MLAELTPRARIPDTRISQLMQPWEEVASLLSHSKNWLGHSSKIELRRLSLSKEKNNWDLMVCSKHKMALKKWLLVCCRWQEEASVFPITPHYRTACLSLNKLTRKFETNNCANSTNCAKTTSCKWRACSGPVQGNSCHFLNRVIGRFCPKCVVYIV